MDDCDKENEGQRSPTIVIDSPSAESLKTESPKTESPKTESPKTESPKAESPKSTDNGQTITGAIGGSEVKWPRPVYFRENDPKKGYVYIIVNVPELLVTKSFLAKNKPENLEVCNPGEVFNEKEVYLRVKVTNREGNVITYEYKKSLPKPIDPKVSDLKFEKGIIKIRLKKEDVDLSWEPYSKVLTIRDTPNS